MAMFARNIRLVPLQLLDLEQRVVPTAQTIPMPDQPPGQSPVQPAEESAIAPEIMTELADFFESGGTHELLMRIASLELNTFPSPNTLVDVTDDGVTTLEYHPPPPGTLPEVWGVHEFHPDDGDPSAFGTLYVTFTVPGGNLLSATLTANTLLYVITMLTTGVNDTGPLEKVDVFTIKIYLQVLAKGKSLSPGQDSDFRKLVARFQEHGLAGGEEEKLRLLCDLGGDVQKAISKIGILKVANQFEYMSAMVEEIIKLLKIFKDVEYQNFKLLVNENMTLEEVRRRIDEEHGGAFRPDW